MFMEHLVYQTEERIHLKVKVAVLVFTLVQGLVYKKQKLSLAVSRLRLKDGLIGRMSGNAQRS